MGPPIYKATYSGVPVYEFPCKNVQVMRRMSDGWVNATHILKVAGFDKPQRTRILEREIQRGKHEKVQGGYGKYQGTWVPLARAREVAAQYEVTELLSPLFDYESTGSPPPPAPKPVSKSKAAARTASAMDSSPSMPTPKKARKVASAAAAGEKKTRARPSISSQSRTPKMQVVAVPQFDEAAEVSADSASVSSRSSSPSSGFMSENELDELNGYPSRTETDDYNGIAMTLQNRQFLDSSLIAQEYNNKLLDYFMAPDDERVPEFLAHPPQGFQINRPIDDESHTPFHWACAMGILKIIDVLMSIGANIHATNAMGQTPLIRSIMFTNCFDRRTFPRIVELLRDTILYIDPERRTILHHIAATTASRSKLSSTRYYCEIILAKLSETQPMHDLAAFLDKQDVNGDTALHIAARHQARKLCKVLLSYHASTAIPNKSGTTAYDYLIQDANMRKYLESDPHHQGQVKSSSSPHPSSTYHNDGNGIAVAKQLNGTLPQHQQQEQPGSNSNHIVNGAVNGDSEVMNGYSNGRIAYPHVAEAAIKATQQVTPAIAEHFEALATAYDQELQEKDADLEQVQQLLGEMKADIASTDESIRVMEQQIGEEPRVRQRITEGEEIASARLVQLRQLVERTQARDLASLVQEEESKIDGLAVNGNDNPEELIALVEELRGLQRGRKKLVEEITDLHAKAGVGERMNDYRRLLASSCQVPVEEIDGLLDSIAQALAENGEEGSEAAESVNQVEEHQAGLQEAPHNIVHQANTIAV